MGHSWAIQIGSVVTFTPPSKNPTSSSVQLTRPVLTHTPCRVPHPRPTRTCICPHTNPSKCPGTFPLSARPYVQCRPICHAVCPISGPHAPCALCPHTDPYAQPRGLALIPLCHTRFYKENQMHLTCAPGSFYTHMIDKTRVIPLQ
jgi:hypothetical protein